MRNIKTREGYEFWDKLCALKRYGFIHSPDNSRVLKTEDIGNWIDMHEAQAVVDQAQDRINELEELLKQSHTALGECRSLIHAHTTSPKCLRDRVYGDIGLAGIDRLASAIQAALIKL